MEHSQHQTQIVEKIITFDVTRSADLEKQFEDRFKNVFIANSGTADHIGDIFDVKSANLEVYNSNPVILADHDNSIHSIVAKGHNFVTDDGQLALGVVKYRDNEKGRDVEEGVKDGFINAVSIRFKVDRDNISYDKKLDQYTFKNTTVLENSLVAVPMDSKALKEKGYEFDLDKPKKAELTAQELTRKKINEKRLKLANNG